MHMYSRRKWPGIFHVLLRLWVDRCHLEKTARVEGMSSGVSIVKLKGGHILSRSRTGGLHAYIKVKAL